MKIYDINQLFEIVPVLRESSLLCCPECKGWSKPADWQETSVSCELCGEHTAMRCPECGEDFDHVGGTVFESKINI